jgi:CheY-like chemotaxis protein
MKKIFIIEDNPAIAQLHQGVLVSGGHEVIASTEPQTALALLDESAPDLILLDIAAMDTEEIEVIRQIRSLPRMSAVPLIVLANAFLNSAVQEALKAGATRCLPIASTTPEQLFCVIHEVTASSAGGPVEPFIPVAEWSAQLEQTFNVEAPKLLSGMREILQNLTRTEEESAKLSCLAELHKKVRWFVASAGLARFVNAAGLASALEAFLQELKEKPKNINTSALRTMAAALDFFPTLVRNIPTSKISLGSNASILVVDDDPFSRKAVVHSLSKVDLKATPVESAELGLDVLRRDPFDLIILDIEMPGMNGLDMCKQIRTLPGNKSTPVIFVTSLSDLHSRAKSTLSGGNDFIIKPFLFMELAIKARIYVQKAHLGLAPL